MHSAAEARKVEAGCKSAGREEGLVVGIRIASEGRRCSSRQNVAWQEQSIAVATWTILTGLHSPDGP